MIIRTNVKAGVWRPQHNEKVARDKKPKSLTVKTGVKAGEGGPHNHNEKLANDKKTKGLIVRTGIKAGACSVFVCGDNHNEKLAMDNKVKSLVVKTGVKAGPIIVVTPI